MKNALFTAAFSAGLVAVAGSAAAEGWSRDGLYGSVKGGWTVQQDQKSAAANVDFNDGYTGSVAVGKTFGNIRGEVEGLYQENDSDTANVGGAGVGADGDTSLRAVMVNGYYDFKNASRFTPFVGAGLGYGRAKYDGSIGGVAAKDADDVLAYQAIAGVGYELNPCWTLTGEYRYVGTTKADLGTADYRYQSHSAVAGVRYTF